MDVKTEFRTYKNVRLEIGRYVGNGSLAIRIWNSEVGCVATITTCIDPYMGENVSFVDTNNCPWALDFIKEYKLGKATGAMVRSCYCMYPAVRFDLDQLRKYSVEEQ